MYHIFRFIYVRRCELEVVLSLGRIKMKKLLTLPNILKACGALLGLVAFFLMFADQLYAEILGNKGYVEFSDAMFDKDFGSWITFIGYLLVLIGALGLCACVFLKDKKLAKLVTFALAGALVLGAIFIFIEAAVVNGRADAKLYHLAAGPIFAGIFALLAGLLGCGSEFVK